MATTVKYWTADRIPQRWRDCARVEPDGVLFLNLRSPIWVKPADAMNRVRDVLNIDTRAAAEAIKIRAASGHLILGAGAVTGYLGEPGHRIRLPENREMLMPEAWHFGADFADEGKAFWATGDVQLRLVDPAWGVVPRVRTYTDVRFLELNLTEMVGKPAPSATIDEPLIIPSVDGSAIVPDQKALNDWALRYYAETGGESGSRDWNRAGQKNLEITFPGVSFKKSEAGTIAANLGLTRSYAR